MPKKIIVGRQREQKILQELLESSKAEFLALYGRRRVGKTFLISEFFRDEGLYFELTGIKGASKRTQIGNFVAEYIDCFHSDIAAVPREYMFTRGSASPGERRAQDVQLKGGAHGRSHGRQLQAEEIAPCTPRRDTTPVNMYPKDWMDAFALLREQIEQSNAKRIILFFDELPWLASPRSGFLSSLDHFWNRHLSRDPRIILIVCGSAASWMIKKVIHNRAGLYGRLTKQMRLLPYCLQETEQYLRSRGIELDRKQVAELYMTMGGIPKYLSEVPRGKSAGQIIQEVFFDPRSSLSSEFRRLYASLFDHASRHIAVVRSLAKHRCGLTRNELIQTLKEISSGGGFADLLTELEESGFITFIPQFGKGKKNGRYLLTDEYSLFYLTWVEPLMGPGVRPVNSQYWQRQHASTSYRSWAGFSFEALCLKHINQVIRALELTVVATSYAGWRSDGAQIDLVIQRADRCIQLCEIKFTADEYVMTEEYGQKLDRKKQIFRETTGTKHTLFTTLIASAGAKRNAHFLGAVDTLLTLSDLFL